MRTKKWTKEQLEKAVKSSISIRQVLNKLGLKVAGGNYTQIKKYVNFYNIDISHFKGRGWNKNTKMPFLPKVPIEKILVKKSNFQSYKLKKRLIIEGLKEMKCEECGWAKISEDGRIPLELDHINGNSHDNRIENLRILCPNCHSLKPTHRSCNQKKPG